MARTPRTLAGSLLVSHPQLRDDHFRETVVLLHSHDAKDGALGVIINRPLGRELGQIDAAVNLAPLEGVPLFEGGPVATDRLAFGGWCFPEDTAPDVRFGLDQEEAVRLAAEGRLRGLRRLVAWSARERAPHERVGRLPVRLRLRRPRGLRPLEAPAGRAST